MSRYLILNSFSREPYSYHSRMGLVLGGIPALFSMTSAERAIEAILKRKKTLKKSMFRIAQASIAEVVIKKETTKKPTTKKKTTKKRKRR